MRNVRKGAEAPRTVATLTRRLVAGSLVGGLSLGLAGCSMFSVASTNRSSGALKPCQTGWEARTALTNDPAAASSSMQRGIAELIDDIDKSGAKKVPDGYRLSTLPNTLVGTASAVLDTYADGTVTRSSGLQNYTNEVCVDPDTKLTYLTPGFMGAVGSLAAADIVVDTYVQPPMPPVTSTTLVH